MRRRPKKFRTASFRNVKFKVEAYDVDLGRRNVLHEYPDRDEPNSEDLGRKARVYPVEAYVIGSSYEKERDALIKAIEKKGPGSLVHPYLGTKDVIVTSCRVSERNNELGVARFSLTFQEAGKKLYPKAGTDSLSSIAGSALGLLGAAESAFSKGFSILSAPAFLVESAQEKLDSFADLIEERTAGIQATTAALADLSYSIRNLKADALYLLARPGQLASRMTAALGMLTDLLPGGDRTPIRRAYEGVLVYGSGFAQIAVTTQTRQREADNQSAMVNLGRRAALANASVEAASSVYTSFDDALTVRNNLLGNLDEQLDAADDDDVFLAMQRLRVDLIKAVPQPSEDLARLTSYVPPSTAPSIVIAYELYQNPDFEQDIIDRNKIRNPAFVLGGRPLEVVQRSS